MVFFFASSAKHTNGQKNILAKMHTLAWVVWDINHFNYFSGYEVSSLVPVVTCIPLAICVAVIIVLWRLQR